MKAETLSKYKVLQNKLKGYGTLAIAFSGGVDSSFLLYAAREALGSDNIIALTARSAFIPGRELREAEELCRGFGVRQLSLELEPLSVEEIRKNPRERCYYCKKMIFGQMLKEAEAEGFKPLCDGSNKDDEMDFRPGMRALEELGILSPLREAGLTKDEIRELSRSFGLATAEKPSFACLASRVPYGEELSLEKLGIIEGAEELLAGLGFRQYRVRLHGSLARIELLQEEMDKALRQREMICRELKKLGVRYISLDLEGYMSGKMN